ncbi:DUF4037 domain-containing protein [Actinocatenispora rupis]|uniref:DUF4037 domain-containing protein n=1 Tax=Actinocatenispora rupis TaxID=519421 RepID=A0A8J3JGP5_9ACTN|nr:DUF4037 domain-containing protein [Actinocatenispora rupis]GID16389.1 hypothetical protein Aru02nite_72780 [Actinocatenispora rupis]
MGDEASGVGVARGFHRDVVGPLIARELPALRYAAARLGSGSDVLGLDDATSRDHDWGCRLTVLVDEADADALPKLDAALAALPETYRGMPVRFGTTWDPTVGHKVQLDTVDGFVRGRLGVGPRLSTVDWLTVTGQSVLEVTAGPVFADATTGLAAVRAELAGYPPQVERYVLAAGWTRVAQRLPMVGRTAQRGQDLGSRLLTATLVGDLTALAFLVCRRWQPYEKWREAALARLPVAGELTGPLRAALIAEHWRPRESALVAAIEVLAAAQHDRGLPAPRVVPFFDRPYRSVEVPGELLGELTDPDLTGLPPVGSLEQWVDSTDVLARPENRPGAAAAYRAWLAAHRTG